MVVTAQNGESYSSTARNLRNMVGNPRDPPWKKPTRPCPFYSQGQCLFSDSCSFLHDVKVKVVRPFDAVTQCPEDSVRAYGKMPLVTGLTTDTSSVPNDRSPRFASLLLALKDVIGEDENCIEENAGEDVAIDVNDLEANSDSAVTDAEVTPGEETALDEYPELQGVEGESEKLSTQQQLSAVEAVSAAPTEVSSSDVKTPSPQDSSNKCNERENSFDSGYGDGTQALPTSISPMSRSGSLHSALNSLSPQFNSPGVRVFYPNPHGKVFSQRSSLTSPVSETPIFPLEMYDRLSNFARRRSLDPKTVGPAASSKLEEGYISSRHNSRPGSGSNSSLSSLDTISSSPVHPPAEVQAVTPDKEAVIEQSLSPIIPEERMLQRDRAVSELTIIGTARNDHNCIPQILPQDDLDDEALDSVYDPTPSDHIWSPPGLVQNFSRPSSMMSFRNTVCSPEEAAASDFILGSPLHEQSLSQTPSVPITPSSSRFGATSGEFSTTKVPFGFRNTKPRTLARANKRPEPLNLSQQRFSVLTISPTSLPLSGPSSLRPLHLSTLLNSSPTNAEEESKEDSNVLPSPSVSSDCSLSNHRLLSSARSSIIPEHTRNTLIPTNDLSPLLLSGRNDIHQLSNFSCSPTSLSASQSPNSNEALQKSQIIDYRHFPPHIQNHKEHRRISSRLSESVIYSDDDEVENDILNDPLYDENIRNSIGQALDNSTIRKGSDPLSRVVVEEDARRNSRSSQGTSISVPDISHEFPLTAPVSRRNSVLSQYRPATSDIPRSAPTARSQIHAIATPRPTLIFAIASDDVREVERVLNSGDAGPNDQIGPQSALEFALMNDQLMNRMDIVKTLLAYGADPSAVKDGRSRPSPLSTGSQLNAGDKASPTRAIRASMDPATRYFLNRADAAHTRKTSALIHRSFFRPLTRMRYDVIGQDCAFEQLFRILSMHSQSLSTSPVVILLCGPSGHGKSLVARRFGSLLDVPTHTVNMTTLRNTHDLWQSFSMSPYEAPSTSTLAEFLTNNEGKRCVVVLDEVDKIVDEKTLWSLLMPWEIGRCSFEAGQRHINVQNVVWLGTANIGHELVFEYQSHRKNSNSSMDRQEYISLMDMFRPNVSKCLGPSLVSRVTTVLPFIPFTTEEQMAIATQAVFSLGGETARAMSPHAVENFVSKALKTYLPAEGARSLYRAVSTQLLDVLDSV